MASITKTEKGWFAQVRRGGVSRSKRFKLKTEATLWAAKIEADLEAHARGDLSDCTLLEAIDKYAIEVSPRHRSHKQELSMLRQFKLSGLPLHRPISLVTASDIARWRDARCLQVSDGSVNRELTVLKLIFSVALREWGLIVKNPCLTVSKRPAPRARDRLIADFERDAILHQLAGPLLGIRHQTRVAFEFALETAMRLGEIVGLSADDVNGRVARLALTKNGSAREVPLSRRALALLAELSGDGRFFTARAGSVSHAFTQAVRRAGLVDLHFHDTRHAAITRLAQKLTVLELARTVGHKDLKSLMTYYNETAENLADKLD